MPLFWLISSCCMSICVIKLISRNDFIYNKWTIRTSKSALLLHNDRDKTSNCELIIWSIVLETKGQYSGWDKGAQGEQLEEEERGSWSNMEMHSLVVRGPNIVHGVRRKWHSSAIQWSNYNDMFPNRNWIMATWNCTVHVVVPVHLTCWSLHCIEPLHHHDSYSYLWWHQWKR